MMASDSQDKKIAKKRGRPKTGTNPTVGVRMDAELKAKIEEWRAEQRPIPSEPEALRRLAALALESEAKKKGGKK
jgi:hypothetical protein